MPNEDDDRLVTQGGMSRSDWMWLGWALAMTGLVVGVYYATHRFPAYGAGFYLEAAAQIRANGYALPQRMWGYTPGGVPFGYPPLLFYVAAVVVDLTGVGSFSYAQFAPGFVLLGMVVAYFALARELLGSARHAGLAAIVFATAPDALRWHLSAGGIVRGPALLFTLLGAYAGLRLFRDREQRWIWVGVVSFGLTVLSHPQYAVYFVVTYLLIAAAFDPSRRGLGWGLVVGLGGFVFAAPWWGQVVLTHGIDVFTAAAGTHNGIGGGVGQSTAGPSLSVSTLFNIVTFASVAYGVLRRRYFLVAWLIVPGLVFGKTRFMFVAGGMLIALVVLDGIVPAVRARTTVPGVPVAVTVMVVLAAVGTGVAFAAGDLTRRDGSPTQPTFVDDADVQAMAWAAENTPHDASYVVLGDAAEWFPHLTGRTILVGPWGAEWVSPEEYYHQFSSFTNLSECHSESCLTRHFDRTALAPDYVYVPKGQYTVRGFAYEQPAQMRRTLLDSDRYELVYENEGVLIFRVVGDELEVQPHPGAGNAAVSRRPQPGMSTSRSARPLP